VTPFNTFLYISTIVIWGSTWLAITYQLGEVDPLISVFYRIGLASALLFIWCWLRKIPLTLSLRNHGFMFAQGCFLFALNFWNIYWAETYLPSGIVAVIFSLLVLFNIINGRLFLGYAISMQTVVGGLIGMSGLGMLFYPEIAQFSTSETALLGFGLALMGVMLASWGNIIATRNGNTGTSVWAINAWSMFYGASVLLVIALATGVEFTFKASVGYVASLIYLSVFGTILAFGAYLKLLVSIGPSRAGYGSLIVPFVAIILSTIFENYQWTPLAVAGFCFVAAGNYLVIVRR
jgi:drug/metabolite transporter (DMT)-like permease|tara:strand:- start:9628 stop:10503 length:876 start_codon:yes stop_codon:yes gene_type:complete